MPGVTIDRITVNRGENLFVNFEGSCELSLHIQMLADGRCLVEGTFNVNGRRFEVKLEGMAELSALEAPTRKRNVDAHSPAPFLTSRETKGAGLRLFC